MLLVFWFTSQNRSIWVTYLPLYSKLLAASYFLSPGQSAFCFLTYQTFHHAILEACCMVRNKILCASCKYSGNTRSKQNLQWKKWLQGEEDFIQGYYNRGEKSELNLRTIYPTETKGRRVFKGWNEPVEKLLENTLGSLDKKMCWAYWVIPEFVKVFCCD